MRRLTVVLIGLIASACNGVADLEAVGAGRSADGSTPAGTAARPDADAGVAPDAGTLPVVLSLPRVGTLLVLGDSISSGGGMGPFYFELLRESLSATYGPVGYLNHAESGSTTAALLLQIASLPANLPGPVVVTITSGVNDVRDALPDIFAGTDQPARDAMKQNIARALDALLSPSRFGVGVNVYVVEANMYDASDGVGDYGSHNCSYGQGAPTMPTAQLNANWNGAIASAVTAKGQTVADFHTAFEGHGYAGAINWVMPDCSHPNSLGNAAIAKLFHHIITGAPAVQ